ncbi:MAG: riboflavin synthase [Caldisphaeraceae archaeon]|nr:riboflavin synthase [Caldisphaeraceae archaeon]MEB3691741.1 riboflavin synthase [Caldisphaeraceae archaeon]MEB3798471.1 riboflavin synthase [Caldisphaeraceae archaeon]
MKERKCIGIVDTTFSRVDMGSIAVKRLKELLPEYTIIRHTVPGIKDLPGEAKRLIDRGCEGVMTLGWVGAKQVDKYSYIALSVGLIMLSILTGKVIVDVTVHEDESSDPRELRKIAIERTRAHAENLAIMLKEGGEGLVKKAGLGIRQGYEDVGPIY